MEFTRRDVLRTSAVGGLGIAVGSSIAATPPAEAAPTPGPSTLGQGAIRDHYLAQGGAAGTLGTPDGPVQAVRNARGVPGFLQHYRGVQYGPEVTCSHPTAGTSTASTVVWSAATGAHALQGAVREQWLKSGGATGKYGYPTTGGTGASGRFEHGEIREHS